MEFSRQEYWSDCHFLLQVIFQDYPLNLPPWGSCIDRQIHHHWATWEALTQIYKDQQFPRKKAIRKYNGRKIDSQEEL